MPLKPKPSKAELREKAQEVILGLSRESEELQAQIDFLEVRKEDCERKIRWVRKELLE